VIDISGEEITFRVDFADDLEADNVLCGDKLDKPLPPREVIARRTLTRCRPVRQ
jgi:hypothetical protein